MSAPSGWLAIDTATDVASVAVSPVAATGTVARSVRGARRHAAQIVPLIHEVLDGARLSFDDIAGVIVGDGPGSFTGVRIGWAAAKGLIQERRLSLITIPSLLAAAYGAGVETVAACYDALRGQVFAAVYQFSAQGVNTLVAPGVFTMSELTRVMERAPLLAVGDGAVRYAEECKAWTGRPAAGLDALPPLAASLLALFSYDGARRAIAEPSVAEPVYGRPAEAQVKWETRHGRPLPNSPR